MRDRVAVECDIHIRREEYRQKKANECEVKDREQRCCLFEIPYVDDDACQQDRYKDHAANSIEQIEKAVQIVWRNGHSENLERANDSTVRAELDHDSFIPVRRRSSCRDRDE